MSIRTSTAAAPRIAQLGPLGSKSTSRTGRSSMRRRTSSRVASLSSAHFPEPSSCSRASSPVTPRTLAQRGAASSSRETRAAATASSAPGPGARPRAGRGPGEALPRAASSSLRFARVVGRRRGGCRIRSAVHQPELAVG